MGIWLISKVLNSVYVYSMESLQAHVNKMFVKNWENYEYNHYEFFVLFRCL